MAWQSVIISNSEDVMVWKFKDLPKLAAGAKKYGVTTFEILGWDIGGIDRGYPQYRPDPRLGTHDEFRQALAEDEKTGRPSADLRQSERRRYRHSALQGGAVSLRRDGAMGAGLSRRLDGVKERSAGAWDWPGPT